MPTSGWRVSEFIVQASQPQRTVERFGRQSRPDLHLHAALRLDIKIIVAIHTFIVGNGQAYGTGKLVCRNHHFISTFNGTDFSLQIHLRIIHILLLAQTVVVMVHPARFVRIVYTIDNNYSTELGKYILKEAGLPPSQINKLQEIPWLDYIVLANRAAAKYDKQLGGNGMMRGSFGPVGDGFHIPMDTFYTDPEAPSAHVPMLFSTTTCEFSISRDNATLEKMNRTQLVEMVDKMKGKNGQNIVLAYEKAFPDKKPIELLGLIMSSREKVIEAINAKAQQSAPVYLAWFGWEPPLFDGRMRSFHCLDISFWLKNTDVMLTHTGGGKRPRDLSTKMTDALLSFMRTGSPNCASLPEWPQYTPDKGATMMLNDQCEVVYDPDREARKVLTE